MSRQEDLGKALIVIGVFLVFVSLSTDLMYFSILLVSIFFFYFLYKNRKNFKDELILVALLLVYMFFMVFFVFLLGVLTSIPPIYMGSLGALLILLGVHQAGYLNKMKKK